MMTVVVVGEEGKTIARQRVDSEWRKLDSSFKLASQIWLSEFMLHSLLRNVILITSMCKVSTCILHVKLFTVISIHLSTTSKQVSTSKELTMNYFPIFRGDNKYGIFIKFVPKYFPCVQDAGKVADEIRIC